MPETKKRKTTLADKEILLNQVMITGRIMSQFRFHHSDDTNVYYTAEILVSRLSNTVDLLPIIVSDQLVDVEYDYTGMYVEIHGQFQSCNQRIESRNRLLLTVYAKELYFLKTRKMIRDRLTMNTIFLNGYICKPPVYRLTPRGKEITDIIMAVNRSAFSYGATDYIPCICWGETARFVSHLDVGYNLAIWGRVQSREYVKKISEDRIERRIAYEVSIGKLKCRY